MGRKCKKQLCYYCGGPATCREHAPPRQMFAGFECDSITVPSCEEHNNEKGGRDQAIVSALLISLRSYLKSTQTDPSLLHPDVVKAIRVGARSFERVKKTVVESPLLRDPSTRSGQIPDLAYLDGRAEIQRWAVQLTAALVYHAAGSFDPTIDWARAESWSPDFVTAEGPLEQEDKDLLGEYLHKHVNHLARQALHWHQGLSAAPRPYPATIYFFRAHLSPSVISFAHRFYAGDRKRGGGYTWYVEFAPSDESLASLADNLV